MKRLSIYSIGMIVAVTAILSSCKYDKPSEENIFYDEATIETLIGEDGDLYTLNEFIDKFMTEEGNYLSDTALYRLRSTGNANPGIYLFSIDTLPQKGRGIYIMGRITTDDYGGNFYKTLVIQQVKDKDGNSIPQQALRISVDAGSMSGMYPRGQMILIRCNGLAIGRYANQPQLCVPSYNNNVFADKASEKVGWAPGRIPLARFKAAVQRIGKPDASQLVYDEVKISDIITMLDLKKVRYLDGKLIRIQGIHYTGHCLDNNRKTMYCTTGNPSEDKFANVFAPTTLNVGHPQSRMIADEEGDSLSVSMSEYAKQANFYLPGASGGEEGDIFYYDSTAVYDISKPFLIADLPNKKGCVVPVSYRKEETGWKVDDVIYLDKEKSKGYIYSGTTWSAAIGVLHCPDYTGSVQGILSFYMDNANYSPEALNNWSVSVCDLSDLSLYKKDDVGNLIPWNPIEYTPN